MTLLGVGLVGTAVFLLLRPTSSGSDSTAAGRPYAALKRAFAIFITKDMLLLSVTNFYTGLVLTFRSGVNGPSIANTQVSSVPIVNWSLPFSKSFVTGLNTLHVSKMYYFYLGICNGWPIDT